MQESSGNAGNYLLADDEPSESLWVGNSGQTNMDYAMVGVCYQCPCKEEVHEAFFTVEEEACRSLILVRELNYLRGET